MKKDIPCSINRANNITPFHEKIHESRSIVCGSTGCKSINNPDRCSIKVQDCIARVLNHNHTIISIETRIGRLSPSAQHTFAAQGMGLCTAREVHGYEYNSHKNILSL